MKRYIDEVDQLGTELLLRLCSSRVVVNVCFKFRSSRMDGKDGKIYLMTLNGCAKWYMHERVSYT